MEDTVNVVPETNVDGKQTETDLKAENIVNNTQPSTPAWMAQLPNDLKANESLSQYKTLGDAVRSLMAKDEPKAEEKLENLEYGEFKTVVNPEDDPFGDIQKGYVELFKAHKIAQSDAEELIGEINKINSEAKKEMIEKSKGYLEEGLKNAWGKDYESKRALANRGYRALKDEDGSLQSSLDKSGASLSLPVWELLSRVGALVIEDEGTVNKVNGTPLYNGVPVDYSKPST